MRGREALGWVETWCTRGPSQACTHGSLLLASSQEFVFRVYVLAVQSTLVSLGLLAAPCCVVSGVVLLKQPSSWYRKLALGPPALLRVPPAPEGLPSPLFVPRVLLRGVFQRFCRSPAGWE